MAKNVQVQLAGIQENRTNFLSKSILMSQKSTMDFGNFDSLFVEKFGREYEHVVSARAADHCSLMAISCDDLEHYLLTVSPSLRPLV